MNPLPTERKPILLRNGNPQGNPAHAPRCGAKTRQGTPCRAPAMANGRCRMHGGKSTGPRTAAGLARSRKACYKHGGYSAEAKERWKAMKTLQAECEALLEQMDDDRAGLK
jgi:hypothetical protein